MGSLTAKLEDAWKRKERENAFWEREVIQETRQKYQATHPELTVWDYNSLIHGLLYNVFYCQEEAEDFVEWIMNQMTPEMLASLRYDSDGFQDAYGGKYIKETGGY